MSKLPFKERMNAHRAASQKSAEVLSLAILGLLVLAGGPGTVKAAFVGLLFGLAVLVFESVTATRMAAVEKVLAKDYVRNVNIGTVLFYGQLGFAATVVLAFIFG